MEGYNNQGQNSAQQVQQLLLPEPPRSDSEIIPQNNSSGGVGGAVPSPRRQRGRPPGSKNKPKPPVIVTRDDPNAFRSHVLEVPAGADIVESLNNYAMQKGKGVCVLHGSGTVSNVTIRQHASPAGGVATLHGSFEVVSVKGTVLPPPAPPGIGGLSIFFEGGQGHVLGGKVAGPLIATTTVVLMAASFANAMYERLPSADQEAAVQEEAGGDLLGWNGGN